jgi:hypothetical protein
MQTSTFGRPCVLLAAFAALNAARDALDPSVDRSLEAQQRRLHRIADRRTDAEQTPRNHDGRDCNNKSNEILRPR